MAKNSFKQEHPMGTSVIVHFIWTVYAKNVNCIAVCLSYVRVYIFHVEQRNGFTNLEDA